MSGFRRSSCRISRLALASTVLVAALVSSPALAASPEQLCGPEASPANAYPDDAALARQADVIERAITRGGSIRSLSTALAVEVASVGSAPSAAALAQYCSAAGEAARTSSEGSQFQAHTYLLSAFRNAEQAGLAELGAQTAYRLGLVHAIEAIGVGTRGATGLLGTNEAEPGKGADTACATLGSLQAMEMRGRAFSGLALECAAGRALATGNGDLSALASLRLARLALATAEKDVDAARPIAFGEGRALDAVRAAGMIGDPGRRANMIGRLVEASLDAGDRRFPEMAAAIDQMRAAAGTDASTAAFAAALEGRLALATGAPAAGHFHRAIQLEAQADLPTRMPDWLLLLARADPEHRYEHVASAFRALEAVRPFLPLEDAYSRESIFSLRMQPVYRAAVDAEFARGGSGDSGITRAQTVVEAYRQAEIQDLFGADCAPPETPFRLSDLRPDEFVLYPVLLDDRLELLFANGAQAGEKPHFQRLAPQPIDRQSINALVSEMQALGSPDHAGRWRTAAARLHALLIAPVERLLPEGATLIMVPDAGLRGIPFAALVDSRGRYLVQNVRLTVAPALAYLQPGDRVAVQDPRVVAAALDREVSLPAGDFPALENTVAEARAVTAVDRSGERRGRVIENFSRAELEQALSRGRVDVLHLATHAAFNGRSDRSFIVAADQLVLLSELRDLIAARRTRGGALDLLVLSACETAVGDDQAAMGLAGAAVQAGATSALASLWQVDDIGTATLMTGFYDGLRSGKSKAAALRDAQVAMIARGGRDADPWVWSAFTMLGGWR